MNGIWVPIWFTILILCVVLIDIWDEFDKFKKEWPLALCALMIKPGLLIVAIWVSWWSILK